MKLSVLIPTVPSRFHLLNQFLDYVSHQKIEDVEFVIFADNYILSIGEKRNILLEESSGDFIVFIDDDDWVHVRYFELLNQVFCFKKVDYIGYMMARSFNGIVQPHEIRSIKYKRCFSDAYGTYRNVSHTNPIRRSIATQFKFPKKSQGEDVDWCQQIFESKLIVREHFVNLPMYEQRFTDSNSSYKGTIDKSISDSILAIPTSFPAKIIKS